MEIMDALEDGHGKLLLGFTSLELLLLKVTDTTGDRLACSVTPQGQWQQTFSLLLLSLQGTGQLGLLPHRGSGSRPSVSCYGHYRGQASLLCYSSGVVHDSRPSVSCHGHYRGQVSLVCYPSGVVAVDLQSLVMVTTGDKLAWSVTPQGQCQQTFSFLLQALQETGQLALFILRGSGCRPLVFLLRTLQGTDQLTLHVTAQGSGSQTLSLLQTKNNRSPFDQVEEGCDIKNTILKRL